MTTTPFGFSRPVWRVSRIAAIVACLVAVVGSAILVTGQGGVGLGALLVALAAVAISFWSLGQYDVIWHRIAGVNALPGRAQASGMAAIAVGQTVGASALTSALVRRTALPGLSHREVAQISGGVALTFTACWSLLAVAALCLAGQTRFFQPPEPFLITALAAGICIALVRLARNNLIRLNDALRLLLWTTLDLTAAALALYLLLPAALDVSFATFWAVFVLAVGAGILSHLPGGLGVFEGVLIACLPRTELAPLILAILAFRLIYYVLPFGLGVLWLQRITGVETAPRIIDDLPPGAPASWGLATQSGQIVSTRHGAVHLAESPFSLISFGDPAGARTSTFTAIAAEAGRAAGIYKCSARLATRLRSQGWTTALVARDAIVNPQAWTSTGRARQGLRRKLRTAHASGIEVMRAQGPLPLDDMARVASNWARDHGGEMGFSMGRFGADYVSEQEVFLIYQHQVLTGFISFHRGPHDWALDLMRHDQGLADGAMHLAIAKAIDAAQSQGVTRMSLAAVPLADGTLARLCKSRSGLTQFKRSFGPTWEPLYHAAPSPLSFWVTALSVTWSIQRPLSRLGYRVRRSTLGRALAPIWQLNSPAHHVSSPATRQAETPADLRLARNPRTAHDKPPIQTA